MTNMTVTAGITIQDGQLLVYGQPLLTSVQSNVVFASDANLHSGFLGASFAEPTSHDVISLGLLEYVAALCLVGSCLWRYDYVS